MMEFVRKSDLDEVLKFAVCLEPVKNPKMLKCYHSFCCRCLKRWKRGANTHGRVSCPACRVVTVLNPGVEQLESDITRSTLTDVLNKIPDRLCNFCPGCAAGKAEWLCKSCNGFMCKGCAIAHPQFKPFSDHEIIAIQASEDTHNEFCKKHPLQYSNYYCEKCQVLLCSFCTTAHQEHRDSVYDARKYSEGYEKPLAKIMTQLHNIYDLPDFVKYQERLLLLEKVDLDITGLKDEVTKHGERIIESIKAQTKNMHESIEKSRNRLERYNDWSRATEALKPYAEKLDSTFNAYSKSKKPADLLFGFDTVYDMVNTNLWKCSENIPSLESLKVPVKFVPEFPCASIGKIVNREDFLNQKSVMSTVNSYDNGCVEMKGNKRMRPNEMKPTDVCCVIPLPPPIV